MLLRVPAASLQELATFGNGMAQLGYPYYAIGVRVAFDAAEAYPKFKFSAIRPLSNEEAAIVVELQKSPQIARILAEGAEHASPATAGVPTPIPSPFEQPPIQPQLVAPAPSQPVPAPVDAGASGVLAAAPNPALVAAPVSPAPVAVAVPGVATGFGGAVEVVNPTPAPVTPTQATPAPSAPASTPEATGGFDAALDAQLDALLPK